MKDIDEPLMRARNGLEFADPGPFTLKGALVGEGLSVNNFNGAIGA
jgi:hypothetical protein